MNKTLHQAFSELGIQVSHHFGGGVYVKETHIPAGLILEQHMHKFDHLSVLVSGKAIVGVDGENRELFGYTTLKINAGKVHTVHAVTDVLWLCVHATSVVDENDVDEGLIR